MISRAIDFLHRARTGVWVFSTDCETSLKVSSPFLGSARFVVSWCRTSVWAFSKDCEESHTHPSGRSLLRSYEWGGMGSIGESSLVDSRTTIIIIMRRSARVLFVGRSGATTTTIAREHRSDARGFGGFGGDPSTSAPVDRADVRRARAAEKRRLRALRGGTGSEEDGTGTGGGDGGDRRRRQRAGRRASASASAFESFVDGMERAGRRASDGFNVSTSGRRKERGRRGERAFDSSAQASAAFEAFVRARLRNGSFGGTGGVGGSSSSFEDFFSGGSNGSNATTTRNDDGFYAGASCPHCAILGLKAKSFVTWDGLKTALRTQAMKWHPDRHADEDKTRAEANFKRVYDAYAALSRR